MPLTQSSSARLLGFIGDWLLSDRERLAESLRRSSGSTATTSTQLRADLSRFGFLLGVTDGEVLFGGDER